MGPGAERRGSAASRVPLLGAQLSDQHLSAYQAAQSDDSVSVDTNASHSTDLSLENGKWLDMDAAIQRCSLHEEGEGHEKGGAGGQIGANGGGSAAPRWELQDEATWPRMRG